MAPRRGGHVQAYGQQPRATRSAGGSVAGVDYRCVVAQFPSMKARELRRVLERAPLSYSAKPSSGGSHTILSSKNGYPDLLWAFHDRQTISPGLVRNILAKQVGMSEDDAMGLL